MQSDPIADMLTRVRNGMMARQHEVTIPKSKIKVEIARILQEEGYIEGYAVIDEFPGSIIVRLKYFGARRQRRPVITNLKRVSKPGRRIYVGKDEIPRVMSGMGIAILTTSQGLMTDREARRKRVGGEILCYVY
ncbi:MAG: 30S ribosomal protein S8 [Anaerolineae bacterium]|nr:30S ribosomal protein S8 [Anaerolineae bacterium]